LNTGNQPSAKKEAAMLSRLRALLFILATLATAAATVGAATVGASSAAQTAIGSPSDVVARLNDTLLSVMREAEPLGFQGRFDRLAPELIGAFNFPAMASIVAGRHWKKLDAEQRKRLIDVFGRSSIATFATRFDGYSGETFKIIEETPGPRGSILVRNKLIKNDGDSIEINYLLRVYRERWRVVDVFLDAKYSEMALTRSEYTSVIANQGFDTLIRDLEEKLARMADTKSP
jgi:phospholipid transport system substrate-binding protein